MVRTTSAVATAVLLFLSRPGAAHNLQVFAMAEGDRITGRAYFAGGHPARGVQIRVLAADGEEFSALTPDADGAFEYRAQAAQDLLVVVQSADGHRAEWPIAASELAGAFTGSETPGAANAAAVSAPAPAQAAGDEGPSSPPRASDPCDHAHGSGRAAASGQVFDAERPVLGVGAPSGPDRLDPAVSAAIEQAVARQVRPLREALAQAQGRTQLRDILGGIGYILGIAGIGIWWSARRRRRRETASERH